MIEVVLSVAVFVLACAVLLLFAMVGELTTRVSTGTQGSSAAPTVEPLEGLGGVEIERWPVEHDRPTDSDVPGVVVVLTTVCTSCRIIGQRLAQMEDWIGSSRVELVVVAGPTTESLDDFRRDTSFDSFFADVGNRWTQGVVGIATAPSAFEVDLDGKVGRAITFANVEGLRFFVEDNPSSTKPSIAESPGVAEPFSNDELWMTPSEDSGSLARRQDLK